MKLGLNLSLMWRGGELIISVTIASDASGTLGTATPPTGYLFKEAAIVITIPAAGAGTEQTVNATIYAGGDIVEDTPGDFAAALIASGQVGDYTARLTGLEIIQAVVPAAIDSNDTGTTVSALFGTTIPTTQAVSLLGVDFTLLADGSLDEDSAGAWAAVPANTLHFVGEDDRTASDTITLTDGNSKSVSVTLTATITGANAAAAEMSLAPGAGQVIGYTTGSIPIGTTVRAKAGASTIDYVTADTLTITQLGGIFYEGVAPNAGNNCGKVYDGVGGTAIMSADMSGTDLVFTFTDTSDVQTTRTMDLSGITGPTRIIAGITAGGDLQAIAQSILGTQEQTFTASLSGVTLAAPAHASFFGDCIEHATGFAGAFDNANNVVVAFSVYFDPDGTGHILNSATDSSDATGFGFWRVAVPDGASGFTALRAVLEGKTPTFVLAPYAALADPVQITEAATGYDMGADYPPGTVLTESVARVSAIFGAWTSFAGGSFVESGGAVTITASASVNTGAYIPLSLQSGALYDVEYDVTLGTASVVDISVADSADGSGGAISGTYVYTSSSGNTTYSFTAPDGNATFRAFPRGTGNDATVSIVSIDMQPAALPANVTLTDNVLTAASGSGAVAEATYAIQATLGGVTEVDTYNMEVLAAP